MAMMREDFWLGAAFGAWLMFATLIVAILVSAPSGDTFNARWPTSKGDKLTPIPYLELRIEYSQDGFCWPHDVCEVT